MSVSPLGLGLLAASVGAAGSPAASGGGVVQEVARVFGASGVPLDALGLAWARVTPTVALVPAFGLKALPAPVRGVLGLALAACIFPAFIPVADAGAVNPEVPWVLLALEEIVRGLPIALAAAIPLWAATMAGGLVDALRGAQDTSAFPVVEGRPSPLGIPLSLLASGLFLGLGGPARAVLALAERPLGASPVLSAVHDLTAGIGLAVALAGPLLAAAVVLEIAAALVARASSPAQIHALVAPVRALGLLAVIGIVLDRMAPVMAASMGP